MSLSEEQMQPVTWLRQQIKEDLDAARIISEGGFLPERWDTCPEGQVNPHSFSLEGAGFRFTQDGFALDTDKEDLPGEWKQKWMALWPYNRCNNEPPDLEGIESDFPVVIVDHGRRQFDHIRRQDPRNIVSRCEALLKIMDLHVPVPALRHPFTDSRVFICGACEVPGLLDKEWVKVDNSLYPCPTIKLLAMAYCDRDGYYNHWI